MRKIKFKNIYRISATLVFFLGVAVLPLSSYGHGVVSTSVNITSRPNHLIEIKVQFNLYDLLSHAGKNYTLTQLPSMTEAQFESIYNDIVNIFNNELVANYEGKAIPLNSRYPSKEQVYALIKREFIESMMSDTAKKNLPYTFDERRFYHVFYFGFKMLDSTKLNLLKIDFPRALGDINVTYSTSKTTVLHEDESWVASGL